MAQTEGCPYPLPATVMSVFNRYCRCQTGDLLSIDSRSPVARGNGSLPEYPVNTRPAITGLASKDPLAGW